MAWFQHEIGMFDDRKIKRLRAKFGMEGYGFWCFLLEQIGKEGNTCRLSTGYNMDDIGIDTGIPTDKVKKIISYMADIDLIHKELYTTASMICVPQFSRYYDEYHRKVRNKLLSMSGQCQESVGSVAYKRDREIDRKTDGNYIKDNNDINKSLIELAMQDPIMMTALEKIGYKKKQ
jgi:hypothetical protein